MKLPQNKLNPKLIALDMDDTLLNKDLIITEKTAFAIKKAADKGIYIVLCSGRTKGGLDPFIKSLGLEKSEYGRYIVSLNGARIFDLWKNEIIYSQNVDGEILVQAFEEAQKLDLPGEIYSPNTIYANVDNEWSRLDSSLCKLNLEVIEDFKGSLAKGQSKMVIPGDPKIVADLQEKLKKMFGEKAVIFTSKPYFLEIMPQNCGKGEALLHLGNHLEIKADEIMAFGDSMNDESMIRLAGLSVAMCNGRKEIQEMAKFVTKKSNNEDGIGDFLEEFVLWDFVRFEV